MHGFIAVLIVGIIALIKWVVEIPERKEQDQKLAQFKQDFDKWTK